MDEDTAAELIKRVASRAERPVQQGDSKRELHALLRSVAPQLRVGADGLVVLPERPSEAFESLIGALLARIGSVETLNTRDTIARLAGEPSLDPIQRGRAVVAAMRSVPSSDNYVLFTLGVSLSKMANPGLLGEVRSVVMDRSLGTARNMAFDSLVVLEGEDGIRTLLELLPGEDPPLPVIEAIGKCKISDEELRERCIAALEPFVGGKDKVASSGAKRTLAKLRRSQTSRRTSSPVITSARDEGAPGSGAFSTSLSLDALESAIRAIWARADSSAGADEADVLDEIRLLEPNAGTFRTRVDFETARGQRTTIVLEVRMDDGDDYVVTLEAPSDLVSILKAKAQGSEADI